MTSLLYPGPLKLDSLSNGFEQVSDVLAFDFNILDFDQDFDFELQPDLSNSFLTGFKLLDHALAPDEPDVEIPGLPD